MVFTFKYLLKFRGFVVLSATVRGVCEQQFLWCLSCHSMQAFCLVGLCVLAFELPTLHSRAS